MLDLITKFLSERFLADVVHLDFFKAFNRFTHRRLIQKLKGYVIKEDHFKWIESFLSGCLQRVVLDDFISDWVEVTSEVPQGSIMDPLMFVIFINDLPEMIEDYCKLYTNDSKIIRIIEDESSVDSLQRDINSV